MTRGIAPLILGYQAFDRDIRIAGVILNQLGGSRHEAKLRAVIEHYTDVPVLGAVQHDARLELVERHLGLMPDQRGRRRRGARAARWAQSIAAQVDLRRVLALARRARPAAAAAPAARRRGRTRRSATAAHRHRARQGLRLLLPRRPGRAARPRAPSWCPSTPCATRSLPALDGLFIGGGFPELFMAELEANVALRAAAARAPSRTACRSTPNAAA